jgi:hypothetical protein
VISVTQRGSFDNAERFLKNSRQGKIFATLSKYGSMGVNALSNATPALTGETAGAWSYKIVQRSGYYSIRWTNSHIVDGRPIAVLLQYGHGTRQGGYVQGRDYIMPAIRPIFDQIAAEAWKEVNK